MSFPKEYKILAGIAVGVIILGWLLFRFGGNSTPISTVPLVDRADAYYKGSQQAKVTLTEFSDFQCPACHSAQTTVDKIMVEYFGKVKLVFRNFPLDIHPLANIAAQAAEAAGKQGKFWEMHDILYDKQTEWGDVSKNLSEAQAVELFKVYAKQLNLNVDQFAKDLSDHVYSAVVSKDYNDGLTYGVRATPTFFVNGKQISSPSYDEIKKGIEEALK